MFIVGSEPSQTLRLTSWYNCNLLELDHELLLKFLWEHVQLHDITSLLLLPSVRGDPSIPATILSTESSISVILIELFLLLAVSIAASFNRFAKSAPVNPGVCLAMLSRVKSSSRVLFFEWTWRMDNLPWCREHQQNRHQTTWSHQGCVKTSSLVAAIIIFHYYLQIHPFLLKVGLEFVLSSLPPPIPHPLSAYSIDFIDKIK